MGTHDEVMARFYQGRLKASERGHPNELVSQRPLPCQPIEDEPALDDEFDEEDESE